jgi:hypothetical protein
MTIECHRQKKKAKKLILEPIAKTGRTANHFYDGAVWWL